MQSFRRLACVLCIFAINDRRRIIWSRPGNPTRGVATTLGITRAQLRNAIHVIKEDAELEPRDNVTIWSDGSVTDANDELIGNIYDEI